MRKFEFVETHRLEDALVRFVIDTVSQWEVDGVIFSLASTNVLRNTKERKENMAATVRRSSNSYRDVRKN